MVVIQVRILAPARLKMFFLVRRFAIGQRVRNREWPDHIGTVIGYAKDIVADNEFWYWCYWDNLGDPESGGTPHAESELIEAAS